MSRPDVPRDPATGRAVLGGRARRRPPLFIGVVAPRGTGVIHLVDLRRGLKPLCGALLSRTLPSDAQMPLCRHCAKREGER